MRMKDRLECYIDGYSTVNIYMINDFYQGQSKTFHLKDQEGNLVPLTIKTKEDEGDYVHYTCAVDGKIEVGKDYLMYEEDAQYCPAQFSHIVKTPEFNAKYIPDESVKPGIVYTPEKTTFTVWAPTANWVSVVLHFPDGDRIEAMKRESHGIWSTEVKGDLRKVLYTYRLKVNGTIQECLDPWNPFTGINTTVSQVNDLSLLNLEIGRAHV